LQLSQETFKLLFAVAVKSSGDISAKPVRGQKIEIQVGRARPMYRHTDIYRPI